MRLAAATLVGLLLTTAAACGGDDEEPAASPADVEVCEIATTVLDLYDRSTTDDTVRMGDVYAGARDDVAELQDDVTVEALRPEVAEVVALPDDGPIVEPDGADQFAALTIACVGEFLP